MTPTPRTPEPRYFQKGDWIRFERDGRLVIAQVEYVPNKRTHVLTDCALVLNADILECRRENNR